MPNVQRKSLSAPEAILSSTVDVKNVTRGEVVRVHGGVVGKQVGVNLQSLPSDEDPKEHAPSNQPRDHGMSKARQIALVATLTGASFLNVSWTSNRVRNTLLT